MPIIYYNVLSCVWLFETHVFSVHGIFQARILEWVTISFSKGIFPTKGSNPHLLHLQHWQAGSSTIWELVCAHSNKKIQRKETFAPSSWGGYKVSLSWARLQKLCSEQTYSSPVRLIKQFIEKITKKQRVLSWFLELHSKERWKYNCLKDTPLKLP